VCVCVCVCVVLVPLMWYDPSSISGYSLGGDHVTWIGHVGGQELDIQTSFRLRIVDHFPNKFRFSMWCPLVKVSNGNTRIRGNFLAQPQVLTKSNQRDPLIIHQ
jgi:hypothetical protein